jgi:hypothetical protein
MSSDLILETLADLNSKQKSAGTGPRNHNRASNYHQIRNQGGPFT